MNVHPLADMFPMLPDDELDELAADIKANGLLHAILVGKDDEGGELLVDGRNRMEACRRAGVEPRFEHVDGVDIAALILSANIARRHMSKGQRAMAVAMIYPDPEPRGRGKKSRLILDFDRMLLSKARAVLATLPETARLVVAGGKPLQDAFDEVQTQQGNDRNRRSQLAKLRAERPDLADKVDAEILSLTDAWAKAKAQAEEQKQQRWAMTMNIIDSIRPLDHSAETATENFAFYDPSLAESRGETVTPARLRRAAQYLLTFADAMEDTDETQDKQLLSGTEGTAGSIRGNGIQPG